MNGTLWFDTHAHLGDPQFDSDRKEVIERAFQQGVRKIVEIGAGPEEWEAARILAEQYPGSLFWAAGLHPYFADRATGDFWRTFESLLKHPQCVAIGEFGLDYAKCEVPADVQKKTCRALIELALKVNKPTIIHCREAYRDLIDMLRSDYSTGRSDLCPGVIHCFSGDVRDAQELVRMGFCLGIDGPLTYPNAHRLREALAPIPLDFIVLETDSPYLAPQSHRGKRNEPSYLPLTADYFASWRKVDLIKLSKVFLGNSKRLYRLK